MHSRHAQHPRVDLRGSRSRIHRTASSTLRSTGSLRPMPSSSVAGSQPTTSTRRGRSRPEPRAGGRRRPASCRARRPRRRVATAGALRRPLPGRARADRPCRERRRARARRPGWRCRSRRRELVGEVETADTEVDDPTSGGSASWRRRSTTATPKPSSPRKMLPTPATSVRARGSPFPLAWRLHRADLEVAPEVREVLHDDEAECDGGGEVTMRPICLLLRSISDEVPASAAIGSISSG